MYQKCGSNSCARLLVGLRHVDHRGPADLRRRHVVAAVGRRVLAQHVEVLLHHLELRIRQRDPRVPALRDEADGLHAPGAGDPDGRVRLLQRPRPDVHPAEVVVLALEVEGAGLGPRPHDQVVGLPVALADEGRVHLVGEGLDAEPHHHAADEPAAREHVEHGELLGHPLGMVVERQRVAEHQHLDAARPLDQRAAMMFGDGMRPYAFWWCSFTPMTSKPRRSAATSWSRYSL